MWTKIIKTKTDVFLLVGDTFAFNQRLLQECLRLFTGFTGDKLFVAGNHELWTRGTDSLKIYDKILPRITKQYGIHSKTKVNQYLRDALLKNSNREA